MLAEAAAVSTLMGRSPSRWLTHKAVGRALRSLLAVGRSSPWPHHCFLRGLLECPPSMPAGFPQSEQSGESRERPQCLSGPAHYTAMPTMSHFLEVSLGVKSMLKGRLYFFLRRSFGEFVDIFNIMIPLLSILTQSDSWSERTEKCVMERIIYLPSKTWLEWPFHSPVVAPGKSHVL